jgi:hypothetical protein
MTNNPYISAIINTMKMSSLVDNPGGGGGFLNPGEGGFGAANAIAIPKRYIIAIKNPLAIVFILIL